MTKITTLTVAVILGVGAAWGESVLPRNLEEGKKLPGSESPDNQFVMLEVFHDDTTQNSVVMVPSDRSKYIGFIPISTEWSTDKPYKDRTTIKWNKTSSLVAVHDSLSKHSKLHVFSVTDAEAKKLVLPDLLEKCANDLKIDVASVRSSGQLPTRWVEQGTLEMTVRLKTKRGKSLSKAYRLNVSEDGKVTLSQPKR